MLNRQYREEWTKADPLYFLQLSHVTSVGLKHIPTCLHFTPRTFNIQLSRIAQSPPIMDQSGQSIITSNGHILESVRHHTATRAAQTKAIHIFIPVYCLHGCILSLQAIKRIRQFLLCLVSLLQKSELFLAFHSKKWGRFMTVYLSCLIVYSILIAMQSTESIEVIIKKDEWTKPIKSKKCRQISIFKPHFCCKTELMKAPWLQKGTHLSPKFFL